MTRSAWLMGALGLCLGFGLAQISCDPPKGKTDTPIQDAGQSKDAPAATDAPVSRDTPAATDAPSTGAYKWYKTCGDPACGGHRPNANVSACTSEKEGDPCATKDQKCDPKNDCNAHLICTDTDPTQQPGGCPRSQRKVKRDIRYLSRADRARLHKALLSLRLATYRYKNHDTHKKWGFIIEDHPHKALLRNRGTRVDLYSYLSMLTAALQDQSRQIKALRKALKQRKQSPPLTCR